MTSRNSPILAPSQRRFATELDEMKTGPESKGDNRENGLRLSTAARLGTAFGLALAVVLAPALAAGQVAKETSCSDGKDDDGDTVLDCADADCFADPVCKPDGSSENTERRCSDWVDNDKDGQTDCDDSECTLAGVKVCKGSAQLPPAQAGNTGQGTGTGAVGQTGTGGPPTVSAAAQGGDDDIPQLGAGMSVEDLIGTAGDIDGERNDVVCSDGIDNDRDGRTDCQDFGCRFDRTVTVCQGDPDFRFSVVARAEQFMYLKDTGYEEDLMAESGGDEIDANYPVQDARFTRLQLRAFGPLPRIEDSFFLLSMRAERTPRLTFAMFRIPLSKRGDYLNINSGGGGMSNALVRSAHKRLLLDPPFYLYNAFEQGNGAAVEVGGPIDKEGKLLYRTFVAGGSGRFTGNVGGRFVSGGDDNFNWSVGGQIHYNVIGHYNRWDSPLLYRPAATTFGFEVGVKYDQRTAERYPALNINTQLRHRRLIAIAELYAKYELDFETIQYGYNIQAGLLLIPKKLLLAADFGEFIAEEPDIVPDDDMEFELPRQETQARLALHYYIWQNSLVGTLLFAERCQDPEPGGAMIDASSPLCNDGDEIVREFRLAGTYRF